MRTPYAYQPRACRTYRVPCGAPQVLLLTKADATCAVLCRCARASSSTSTRTITTATAAATTTAEATAAFSLLLHLQHLHLLLHCAVLCSVGGIHAVVSAVKGTGESCGFLRSAALALSNLYRFDQKLVSVVVRLQGGIGALLEALREHCSRSK